jgi:8-oxo-dGTP pyrophosphatase MutT (NUDIX family)
VLNPETNSFNQPGALSGIGALRRYTSLAQLEGDLKRVLRPVSSSTMGSGKNDAAVLILTRLEDGVLTLLFERRVMRREDRWSGQVAFPGGRFEEGDVTLNVTACREFQEETGVDICSFCPPLGFLPEVRPANLDSVRVVPFVSITDREFRFRPNEEVNELFWGPAFEMTRESREINVNGRKIRTKALVYKGYVIWGMTLRIIEDFSSALNHHNPY